MKKLIVLSFCLWTSIVHAQNPLEKEIKTQVSAVTVFTEGAQETRKKNVDLPQGTTILKFTELSPFIDAKSIQIKATGSVMVLSVNHQLNHLQQMEKSKELEALDNKLTVLDENIKLENTLLSIIAEELAFLQTNRNIGGKNQEVSVSNLKSAADYYHEQLTRLKLKEIEGNKTLEKLSGERNNIQRQISSISGKKEFPKGEILVKVDAKTAIKADFELSYLVANAGWFPSYDIRVKNVNEPVQLVYKANVRQDTKSDWKNVNIKLSSSNPNVNNVAPKLKTYFLNYHVTPPTYSMSSNQIKGRVTGSDNEALPGVNVLIKGSTIGTITDINGFYSLTLPEYAGSLVFSYVGYSAEEVAIGGRPIVNVQMMEDVSTLSEVVVVGYATQIRSNITGAVSGVTNNRSVAKAKSPSSLPVPTVQVENQTSVEFEIKTSYTINSDNKVYTIDIDSYSLPAYYEYYCAPKINRDAFLMAYMVDWEKYNLLEGEASLFFEDTYIGKSLLDVRYVSDTLRLSLGRDKNVIVNREKVKDFTTRQFIGNKKEDLRTWNITVKNNKSQKVNMVVVDQVPVSTLEEIEVDVKNKSGAAQNQETGEITWKFSMEPSGKKEMELKYGIKYPKNRSLLVE